MQHVIYYQQHFNSFCEVYGTPNNLLRALPKDLNEIQNLAGCKALGIIDKLVTAFYWQKGETVENILDLNPVIEVMQKNCLQWSHSVHPTPTFSSFLLGGGGALSLLPNVRKRGGGLRESQI